VTSFSKWDRDAYRARVGEEEAARRRGAIMAEQWGYQLAEQRRRLGFTQAGLAEIMGGDPRPGLPDRARRGLNRRGACQLHRSARRKA
jgi:hypothetical protein